MPEIDSTMNELSARQIKRNVIAENEEKFKTELLKACQTMLEKNGGRFIDIEGENLLEIQLTNGVCVYFQGYSREILNEGTTIELSRDQMRYILPEPFLGTIGGGSILCSKDGKDEYRVVGKYDDENLNNFSYTLDSTQDANDSVNTMKKFLESDIPNLIFPEEVTDLSIKLFQKIYNSVKVKQLRTYTDEESLIFYLERQNDILENSLNEMRAQKRRLEKKPRRDDEYITMKSIIASLKKRREKMDMDTKQS